MWSLFKGNRALCPCREGTKTWGCRVNSGKARDGLWERAAVDRSTTAQEAQSCTGHWPQKGQPAWDEAPNDGLGETGFPRLQNSRRMSLRGSGILENLPMGLWRKSGF